MALLFVRSANNVNACETGEDASDLIESEGFEFDLKTVNVTHREMRSLK